MRRFYAPIDDFTKTGLTLGLEETRHLRDVLRLREGEKVSIFNGEGKEFCCLIDLIEKRHTSLSIIEETSPASPESPFELTLAAAILKGEKFDLVIQKAVEMGVTAVIPLQTIRSDVRLKDEEKRVDRWRRIVLEATKQCGRARLMGITRAANFAAVIDDIDSAILFSERGGHDFSEINPSKKITAFIGPEGGWDDSELELARANKNVSIVTLGGRILRAETAAIAISAILQHRFGDLK